MITSGPPALADLSREECLRLLGTGQIGRLVVLTGLGNTPVIRPVNYVFDEASQSVVFRCTEGTKLVTLLRASRAWFEVDDIDPARRTGWSVLIAGVTEPVTESHEIRRLERLGLESWIAGPESRWVRIRARVVSGRRVAASVPATESDT
jgi:nitroimidazol reductase NimA-like FMN-containing flavoprotein (pyridoxamine 5'-phosphate oxidase superfamily)